jgi:hypothetical protein
MVYKKISVTLNDRGFGKNLIWRVNLYQKAVGS